MQLSSLIFAAIFLALMFTIGLNIGMHGLLSGNLDHMHLSIPTNSYYNSISSLTSSTGILHVSSESLLSADRQKINHLLTTSSNAVHDGDIPATLTSPPLPMIAAASNKNGESQLLHKESAVPIVSYQYKHPTPAISFIQEVMESTTYINTLTEQSSKYKKMSLLEKPISDFIQAGKSLPILLLTCNRFELLDQTLGNLLSVKGVDRKQIIVSQDGTMGEIKNVVNRYGLKLVQNTEGLHLRGYIPDGASRIAMHYRFSLSKVFELIPDAPAVIIVEDDLLFAPDFYEYFLNIAPILETDKTVFVASAWNDNGFKGKINDNFGLRRTEFFPGLGWLLSRKLYKGELETKWPSEHWDHWLRSLEIHKGREIVYPEVPRTFHNGIKGTFMDLETHNRYFRDIDYNTNKNVSWSALNSSSSSSNKIEAYSHVLKEVYEERIVEMISKCTNVFSLLDLFRAKGVLCLWIDVQPDGPYNPPDFDPIAKFFGIWHEHKRGAHHGLHEFFWEDKYILILNVFAVHGIESYKSLMPSPKGQAAILHPRMFDRNILSKKELIVTNSIDSFAAEKAGIDCHTVCKSHGKECISELLSLANSCHDLTSKFPCSECKASSGYDQPAYVDPAADAQHSPGTCLFNGHPDVRGELLQPTCEAAHPATIRLCTCV